MENKYTRKEIICPLANALCDREDKDCNICIGEEMEWEKSQSKEDCYGE